MQERNRVRLAAASLARAAALGRVGAVGRRAEQDDMVALAARLAAVGGHEACRMPARHHTTYT